MVDVGDLLHTVEGESVQGLDISSVVHKIIGPPKSRVTLEIYRARQNVQIPPTPVMVAPFLRKEIVIRRELSTDSKDSKVAGLGILFHKVLLRRLQIYLKSELVS